MRPFSVLIFFQLALLVDLASAGPIYVTTDKSGVIRFSSKPPPKGVKAEVFTGKGVGFSVYGRGYGRGRGFGRVLFHDRYHDLIISSAKDHRLDPALLKAVIHVESAFNPKAVSPKGAMGLMQLMPGTAKIYSLSRPFEPKDNIRAGSRHLAYLLRRYRGNLSLALAAYNAGEEAVSQYGGIPPYTETRSYVDKVVYLKQRYAITPVKG
ncbi:MAG: hypothetical protein DCC75_11060 [Proteobacteria bacterium]|nr:MAG: hypothetical protein DCC75_11060 [Pseudomonadota bacterium]